MKEVINALLKLQEIDNEVYKYVTKKDELADTLNELKDLVARMEASVRDKKAKLADVETWYNDQQKTIEEYNKRMADIKSTLTGVTKTKEYLIRQKELENLRRHKQSKEEEIEKVADTIKDFRDAIEQDEKRIEELKQDTEQEGGATWAQVRELEATIAEISKARDSIIPDVPKSILRKYEQIKKARDGVAIVYAGADAGCGGCHVTLRPQVFITLLRQNTLETCPQCNRFVVVSDELVEELKNAQE